MARVFLDTNFVIDLFGRNKGVYSILEGHELHISPFSILVLSYTRKTKVPSSKLSNIIDELIMVKLDSKLIRKSSSGPTSDIEDNVQLHSAAECEAEYFLTNDKKLLNMKFFGKTRIASTL